MKKEVAYSDLTYKIYLVYYLLLQFFVSEAKWDKFSILYFAIVLPVLGFIALNFPLILKFFYSRKSVHLIMLLFLGITISLFRFDYATIYNLFILIVTIIIIIESRVKLTVSFLNKLYLIAIFLSIISFHSGLSRFGYIPFLHDPIGSEPAWKISIFPTTPSSGYFSMLIIVINFYYNKGITRYIFYILGIYFLILSGIRSAILLAGLFLVFNIVKSFIGFRYRKFYLVFNSLLFILFVLIVNFNLASRLQQLNSTFIDSLILKSSFQNNQKVKEEKTNYRVWLWEQHFDIFLINPVAGVGSFDITDHVEKDLFGRKEFEGSESFFTLWLARIGISFFLFIAFAYAIQQEALRSKNKYLYNLSLFLLVIMLSYGSFLMPYNFMFILIFGTLKLEINT